MPLNITITNASGGRYRGKDAVIACVRKSLVANKVRHGRVDIVFLSDAEMKKLNKKFLQHNYTTDVITFPLEDDPLYGEIYISLDTARRQADEYGVTLVNELSRLAVHGSLHLVGFDDATDEQRAVMNKLETRYISL